MNPIKNFLNNILEMKSNKHNLNQGNKFLNNKNKFMVFSKNIENFDMRDCEKGKTLNSVSNTCDACPALEDENATFTTNNSCAWDCETGFVKKNEKCKAILTGCDNLFEKVLDPPDNKDNTFKYNNGSDNDRTNLVCTDKEDKEKDIAFLENNYIPYLYKKEAEKKDELDTELKKKKPKNVKDAKGNIYYLNSNNQYYLYEDSTG